MTVADKIKELREKAGLSQEELAHKMGLKSRSSITRIEKSGDNVSPLYLMDWIDETENDEEKERVEHFISLYSRLDVDQQKLVDSMIETFLSKQ